MQCIYTQVMEFNLINVNLYNWLFVAFKVQGQNMADGTSLINLGELSKPATVLVEKVCNAVGIVFEPTRIVRQANAEAKAEIIKAKASVEIRDIEQRAINRLVHQETRKQENIESITFQAATKLPPDSKVESLDEDWVAHFFKQCDTVSDEEMQSLWASLLSGEATNPGTFSKRTVEFVSSIDKKDAALFTSLCQFIWDIGGAIPLVFDTTNEIYKKHGINFSTLKHLDAIGLISYEPLSGYIKSGYGKYAFADYFGKFHSLDFGKDAANNLNTGQTLLTGIGLELLTVCGSVENQEFYEYAIEKWAAAGIIVATLIKQPNGSYSVPSKN